MSSIELDLPIVPSADQIRRREFATVRRGYDPDQVRDYLRQIGEQVEKLEEDVRQSKSVAAEAGGSGDAQLEVQAATDRAHVAELQLEQMRVRQQDLEAQLASAPSEPSSGDAYRELAERMADVMRTADLQAGEVRVQAGVDAQRVLTEARSEADRIRTDSQEKAESVRTEADKVMDRSKEEADRMLASLHSKRESLMAELEHMRERMLAMAQSLEAIAAPAIEEAPPAENKFFSESQLKELWADGESVDLIDEEGLTESVDLSLKDLPAFGTPEFGSDPVEDAADEPDRPASL